MFKVEGGSSVVARQSEEPHFIVGQDSQGHWLAVETHNLGGGLFKTRQAALHFVDFETGHRPGAFEIATAPLQIRF